MASERERALEEALRKLLASCERYGKYGFTIGIEDYTMAERALAFAPAPSAEAEDRRAEKLAYEIAGNYRHHVGFYTDDLAKDIAAALRSYAAARDAVPELLATIRELQKRIGELEAELSSEKEAIEEAQELITAHWNRAEAERKRREDCEAALQPFAKIWDRCQHYKQETDIIIGPLHWARSAVGKPDFEDSTAYFARYEKKGT